MANWTNDLQPFGPNHAPLLAALASDQTLAVPLAADKSTGGVYVFAPTGTGSAVPLNAFYMGAKGTSGLEGVVTADLAASTTGTGLLGVGQMGYNGSAWNRIRVPTGFHSVATAASGTTTLWTPATGKRFRIMGYDFQMTGNATQSVAGIFTVTLLDGATDIQMTHSLYVPSAAGQSLAFDSGWHNFGNGYQSIAINNVLSINLSAALTAGVVRINVMGMEE